MILIMVHFVVRASFCKTSKEYSPQLNAKKEKKKDLDDFLKGFSQLIFLKGLIVLYLFLWFCKNLQYEQQNAPNWNRFCLL